MSKNVYKTFVQHTFFCDMGHVSIDVKILSLITELNLIKLTTLPTQVRSSPFGIYMYQLYYAIHSE